MKHKTIAAFIVMFFLLSSSSIAQRYEENRYFNFGFGLSGWGVPVYAGFDFTVAKNITVGGEASFRFYKESSYWDHSIIVLSANGNYHFKRLMNLPPDFDVYAGLSLGYGIWSTTYKGPGSSPDYGGSGGTGLYLTAQAGMRFFFMDNWAVNVEVGGGSVAAGKIGLTYWL